MRPERLVSESQGERGVGGGLKGFEAMVRGQPSGLSNLVHACTQVGLEGEGVRYTEPLLCWPLSMACFFIFTIVPGGQS